MLRAYRIATSASLARRSSTRVGSDDFQRDFGMRHAPLRQARDQPSAGQCVWIRNTQRTLLGTFESDAIVVTKSSRPLRNIGDSRSPAPVSASGRGRRRNSGWPHMTSSKQNLVADRGRRRASSAAASLKLMCLAAASKARSEARGSNFSH